MVVKYVKDFDFPSSAGFHGGAKGYAKGGAVKAPTRTQSTMKREMTQSNKLSGNGALPRISNMDVNKQSGGAGTKLMPGYKNGGQVQKYAKAGFVGGQGMPGVGQPLKRSERKTSKAREAALDAENARIAAEEARPLNRLRKFAENTSADVKQGFKTNIKKPLLRAVAKAGPRIANTLSKIPNKKAKALGLGAAALGAGAASLMGDDDEAEVVSSRTATAPSDTTNTDIEIDEIPVTAIRRTETLSAPAPKKNLSNFEKAFKAARAKEIKEGRSGASGVFEFNGNKYETRLLEEPVPSRKSAAPEDENATPMMHGGKVSKYADGGSATYGTTMTPLQRSKMKRGSDPYEDRTRGLGVMTDAEAEAASKELREKYGKKEDKPVMHPGGRQRFLLNQNEKTPMKSGGKAESSKSDMKQDRALMSRHNRLMHPDQKSKMKNGGKSVPSYSGKPLIKKSGGGGCNY